MSTHDSTGPSKPSKPYPDFPLFAHACGYWAKKIRGKMHYFGKWDDPDAALRLYLERRDALHAGLVPSDISGELTVRQLVGKFLTVKTQQHISGELSVRSLNEYKQMAKRLLKWLSPTRTIASLGPDDFTRIRHDMAKKKPSKNNPEIAKGWGVYRIANEIVRIKTVFKFGFEEGLIPRVPVYGTTFRPPSKKTVRLHRAAVGSRVFTADEVRRILGVAKPQLRAMVLLALNAGFGNTDLAKLPFSAIAGDWLDFPRPKTGVERRIPLWRETLEAIAAWQAVRPAGNQTLVFSTRKGGSWAHDADGPLSKEFRKLLDKLGIKGAKTFYSLRRTFQNVAENATRDFLATRAIMGHVTSSDASEFYREDASDDRLRAVVDAVRKWLFGE